jgi:hypothetical protein
MKNPFKRKEFILEYTHVTGRDLVKFTLKSNDINEVFTNHIDFVDKFLKESEKQKKQFSTRQQEEMK